MYVIASMTCTRLYQHGSESGFQDHFLTPESMRPFCMCGLQGQWKQSGPAQYTDTFCCLNSQEAALMKLHSQYKKGRDARQLLHACTGLSQFCLHMFKLYGDVKTNIQYLMTEKWSCQNRTSLTGSAALMLAKHGFNPHA